MSLTNKLSIYIGLLIIAIFCAISTVFLHYGAQREERLMSLYASLMVENSTEKLNNEFSRIEEQLSASAPVVAETLHSPGETTSLLKRIVEGDSIIMGGSVALRPGVISHSEDSLYMDYVCLGKDGRWDHKQLGDSNYDYTTMGWYRDAVDADGAVWSEPYFDKGAGNEMMVTCSYPLHDKNGKSIGVLTADVSLSALSDVTSRLTPVEDGYSFILSDNGTILAHPDSSLILNKTIFDYSRETGCSHLAEIGRGMMAGNSGTKHIDVAGDDSLVVYEPVPGTGWSICSVCPYKSVMSRLDLATVRAVLFLLLGLVIMLPLIRLVIIYSMRPLVRLTGAASKIASGDLNADLPEMKPSDDIGRLNNAFAAMQKSLRLQMKRLVDTTKAKEHIESELRIARNIQMSLVPHQFSPFSGHENLELYALIRPAKEVGGDFYDFLIRDGKLFFTIGDVSGKGVPAALVMAVARTLFRSSTSSSDSPAEIIGAVNTTLCKDNENCMFVTMFTGVLDLATSSLTLCNAGHNKPVLICPQGVSMIDVSENIPVGVMDDFIYEEETIQLRKGCKLFLYTDGLTEAENGDKTLYGDSRMMSILTETAADTPQETIMKIEKSVDGFAGGVDQSDDLTMLCLRPDSGNSVFFSGAFTNSLSIVNELPGLTAKLASRYGLSSEACGRINLILEEALVNVVSYAYPEGVSGEITLTIRHDDIAEKLIFEIADEGTPFDPTAAPAPDQSADAEDRPIGGLGIHLVRTLSDNVQYARSEGRNILTITVSGRDK